MDAQEKFDYWLEHAQYDIYPDFKINIANATSEDTASNLFEQTKEVFAWLQTLKP